jgi:V8-like Glu-specific endopeptidase
MTSESNSHDDKTARAGRRSRFGRAAVAAGLAAGVGLLCAAAAPAFAATSATSATAVTPPASSASGHLTGSASEASTAAKRTVAYWTRARMLSAANGASVSVKSADSHAAPAIVPGPAGPAGRVGGTAPDEALKGPAVRIPATHGTGARPQYGSIGSPWTGSLYEPPATTTGRVFFTTHNGEDWSCSASTVNSAGKDSVITAGHCVYGSLGGEVPGEGWHTNWIFVPDYDNGYAPYGVWTAKELWTPTNYYDNQDEGDDMGGAVINTNGYGQHIVNVVGGQGIAWNYPNDQFVYDFGYPAGAPFNGATLQYCTGSEFNWSGIANTMGLPCNFTGGSSGGPWLMSFNGEFGYVNGVNDFGYSSLPGYIFAAYFGNNAGSLYDVMANL